MEKQFPRPALHDFELGLSNPIIHVGHFRCEIRLVGSHRRCFLLICKRSKEWVYRGKGVSFNSYESLFVVLLLVWLAYDDLWQKYWQNADNYYVSSHIFSSASYFLTVDTDRTKRLHDWLKLSFVVMKAVIEVRMSCFWLPHFGDKTWEKCLKSRWNGSSDISFLLYCDIDPGVMDYHKKSAETIHSLIVDWIFGCCTQKWWQMNMSLQSRSLEGNKWLEDSCIQYFTKFSPENPVMTFW